MGDLGQRRVGLARILEAVVGHADGVGSAAPFAHEACSRSDPQVGRDGDVPVRLQFLGHRRERALRRFAQAAIRKLLHAIGNRADQQVAAQPWRLTAIEPAPLVAELLSGQAA